MRPGLVWRALFLGAWMGQAVAQEAPTSEADPEVVPAAPSVDPAEVEGLKATVAVQEQQISATEAALTEQQAELDALKVELAQTKLDMIPEPGITLSWEGHYRVRAHLYNRLFESQIAPNGDYNGDAKFMSQRLWLRPVFNYQDLAKLLVEFRAMDNVLWGDNNGNQDTPLFAELPSNTTLLGQEQPSVQVSRAWMEFMVPVGLLRVGRQPSNWGMGLLANSGDRDDHKFGDSNFASTNDRIAFGTRPMAIVEAATGKGNPDFPLTVAVAVDRLVEDPLIQYFGYKCSPGDVQGVDDDYDPRCDSDGDGVTDLDHDYTEDRTPSQRATDFWADPLDDVWEMVYVIVYRGENIDYLGGKGDLAMGAYVVHRKQQETNSDALVADAWLSADVHGVLLEAELISITGGTAALALPGAVNEASDNPLQKQAKIFGYAGQVGYHQPGWKVLFEHGFASGDDDVIDGTFTGRPLNPDHNVGILLYEEVLSAVTAANWTQSAQGLWSLGGVYNSRYIFPTVHVYPLDNWELKAGFVTAWPDRPDGSNIQCRSSDKRISDCATPASLQATANTLGWEVDVGLAHTWHEHLQFRLEAAAAQTTDRINTQAAGLNPEGKFFTVQSRLAWVF